MTHLDPKKRHKVIVYIDGFNLYHGIKAAFGDKYLWLNMMAMAQGFLRPEDDLLAVRYFTTKVIDQPSKEARQSRLLKAMGAVGVETHLGKFQRRTIKCHTCQATWKSYEEKFTDVAIGVRMVEDAATSQCDRMILVSADSDLIPAIESVRRVNEEVRLIVAFPPKRQSVDLRKLADGQFAIGEDTLRAALLPPAVTAADGYQIHRPSEWGAKP